MASLQKKFNKIVKDIVTSNCKKHIAKAKLEKSIEQFLHANDAICFIEYDWDKITAHVLNLYGNDLKRYIADCEPFNSPSDYVLEALYDHDRVAVATKTKIEEFKTKTWPAAMHKYKTIVNPRIRSIEKKIDACEKKIDALTADLYKLKNTSL